MNRKVKSFTLAEMLVVMLVTSIIINISFLAFNFTIKNVHLSKKFLQINSDIDQLSVYLWKDMHSLSNSYCNALDSSFVFQSEVNKVNYMFSEHFVIRNCDTLFVENISFKFYNSGNIVKKGVYDAMKFETKSFTNPHSIFVTKSRDFENNFYGI